MSKDKTAITMVLDKSGSMGTCINDTIGGFNEFVKGQKKTEGDATLTLIQFSNTCDVTFDGLAIDDTAKLNSRNYSVGGLTALNDAIGLAIERQDEQLLGLDDDDKPTNIVVVVITDGGENASRKFDSAKIQGLINDRKANDWQFVFIGANQDAIKSGGSLGVSRDSSFTYDARVGTKSMYTSLSRGLNDYRTKRSCCTDDVDKSLIGFAFDDSDRDKQDVD